MSHLAHWEKTRSSLLKRGIMVDVEAAGPAPSRFALLSLGASVIGSPDTRFYVEMKPDRFEFNPAALRITGFTLEGLTKTGEFPQKGLSDFHHWLKGLGIADPKFVANNVGFDWMFYADYVSRYNLKNPFGYHSFDTNAAFGNVMHTPVPHHAGEDAYIQTLDLLKFFKTF